MCDGASLRNARVRAIHDSLTAAAAEHPRFTHIALRAIDRPSLSPIDPYDLEILDDLREGRIVVESHARALWSELSKGLHPEADSCYSSWEFLGDEMFVNDHRWYGAFFSSRLSPHKTCGRARETLEEIAGRILSERLPEQVESVVQSNAGAPIHIVWIAVLYAMTSPRIATPDYADIELREARYRLIQEPKDERPFRVMALLPSIFSISARVFGEILDQSNESANATSEIELAPIVEWVKQSAIRKEIMESIHELDAAGDATRFKAPEIASHAGREPTSYFRSQCAMLRTKKLLGGLQSKAGYWLTEKGRMVAAML